MLGEEETEDITSDLLPTQGGYDDSDADETPDTETDTADADTDTETGDEDNPDLETLRKYGLDSEYKTVDAALVGAAERRKYIEQQRRDNETLRRTLQGIAEKQQTQRQEAPSAEDLSELFAQDPEAALRRMGYTKREEIAPLMNQLQQVQARIEHQAFVGALDQFEELKGVASDFRAGREPSPGKSALWDKMNEIYVGTPSLQNANQTDVLPLLYATAKQHLSGAKVEKVPDSKKRGASTTGTSRNKRRPGGDVPDWKTLSEKEIEEWFRKNGLVS